MKQAFILPLVLLTISVYSQNEILEKYNVADGHYQAANYKEAYRLLNEIEPKCDKKDTLYNYILWYQASAVTQIEQQFRSNEQFDSSFRYGLEALDIIKKAIPNFDKRFAAREHWMIKNIIVSCFGMGKLDEAKKYKNILYRAYKNKMLPEGLTDHFNFSFFKWEDKNVWGYEWFEELPENRMGRSFSKVVYYVYSTNPDGSDKDQLYRLHVLMFHKIDESVKFDYVLTKRLETAKNEASGTLYAYTYDKDIDYKKLQADIKEVLKGNYQPGSKSTINKQ